MVEGLSDRMERMEQRSNTQPNRDRPPLRQARRMINEPIEEERESDEEVEMQPKRGKR